MIIRSIGLARKVPSVTWIVSSSSNLHFYTSEDVITKAKRCISTSTRQPMSLIPTASSIVAASPPNLKPYLQIMRVDKPIGTWLLYWPCTWSIAMATPAGQLPSLYMLSLFGAGAFLMRSAGCVINDLWDKDFDKQVERTKLRPLACGSLTEKQAVGLLAGLLSSSLAILLQLNWFSVAVGASSMALVVGYPLAKRYTYWPQFILGATLNWSVLIAWAELGHVNDIGIFVPLYMATILHTVIYDTIYSHQHLIFFVQQSSATLAIALMSLTLLLFQNSLPGLTFNWGALLGWAALKGDLSSSAPFWMYAAALQWTLVYDTIYAHQDKADDIMIGVKSTALRLGADTKKWLSAFGVGTVASLTACGMASDQTWPYYVALAATSAQLGWQIGTVDIDNGSDCWNKFKSNSWMGVILFSGIVASTLLKEEEKAKEAKNSSVEEFRENEVDDVLAN